MKFLNKLAGNPNKKTLARFQPIVQAINELEEAYKQLSDEALKAKTQEFKKRAH